MAIHVLDRDQCLRLMAEAEIGRLAVNAGNTPAIFPVNYALDGGTIVFRTDPGTKLTHGPRARASFEVDRLDHAGRAGLERRRHRPARRGDPLRRRHLRPGAPAGDRSLGRRRQGALDAAGPRSSHRSTDRFDRLTETRAMTVVMTR
jgi:Pyridoxamine 5'-phosphate oxidase